MYVYAGDFSEGLAVVKKDGKFGCINKLGELVIPYAYDGVEPFSDGLAKISEVYYKNGYIHHRHGNIDKTGKLVIPCSYDFAEAFSEGFAKVEDRDKVSYINKVGETIVCNQWQGGTYFNQAMCTIANREKKY